VRCLEIILLKCTSTYPANSEHTNIRTKPHLRDLSGGQVGLSDHYMGIGVAVVAVALSVTVIEKHFTLSRADWGVDAAFSLEPDELRALVVESERAWQSLGSVCYGPTGPEIASLKYIRSIYAAQDIGKGDAFTLSNIRGVRPGYGLAPRYYEILISKTATCDIKKGTPMSWEQIV